MNLLTLKSNRVARYYLCQYVRDPFRRECRNVGVIVQAGEQTACRFVGESDPGGRIDGRSLREFADPDNYRNWVSHWRRTAERHPDKLGETLFRSNRESFAVVDGGFVGDIDTDSADEIARSLFEMLVGSGSLDEAMGNEIELPKSSPILADAVSIEFRKLSITSRESCNVPVYRSRDLIGRTRPHRFEFLQANGAYVPMEVFSFDRARRRELDHHVGWAVTAFNDVVEAGTKPTKPQSIVKPPDSDSPPTLKEAYDLAMTQLPGCSHVIRWDIPSERDAFLNERYEMAFSSSNA